MSRWLQFAIPLLILAAAVAIRAVDPAPLQDMRLRVFDSFQRIEPRAYRESPVVVVDIDDESLARLGQWPWPRTLVADLVVALRNAGAATVAFDIVFAEPDRTAPALLARQWGDTPAGAAMRELVASGRATDPDMVLADAMTTMGGVVAGFALTEAGNDGPVLAKAGFATAGLDPRPFLTTFAGAIPALPALQAAAAGNGCFNVTPEHDGIARRVPLLFTHGDTIRPSLAAEALRVAQGAGTYVVRSVGASGVQGFGQGAGVVEVRIGDAVLPTDAHGRIWLYDTGRIPERTVPAWRALAGELPPGRVDGHIALIGTSAAGLKDQRTSPLAAVVPGVELHAQIIEQAIHGDFLTRPDWAEGAETAVMLPLGLLILGAAAARRHGSLWTFGLALGASGGLIAGCWFAFGHWRLLLDPSWPVLALLVVYVAASLLRFLRTEREKRQIRTAFGFYMAPALVQRLADNPALLRLGGEMRDLTVLFCDIRGFTAISERLTAEELTRLINRFLTPMTDTILSSGGTIDKYMGDCIMAFWNAPLDDSDHARHAALATIAMRQRLAALNAELETEAKAAGTPFLPIRVGIGLNTGLCCVGNMGSAQRFDYSAIGDDVNLASRLEGQCKTYGVETILGESTRTAVPDLACLELDLIRVVGKSRPVRIHTLIDTSPEDGAFRALASAHAEMLAAYRAQAWAPAGEALARCRASAATYRLTGLYDLFAERIAEFENAPPGSDWDGVYVSKSK